MCTDMLEKGEVNQDEQIHDGFAHAAKALFIPRPETGESQRMSTKAVDDCDASTRDDERSPTWRTLGQVAQDGKQVASRHQVIARFVIS